jgi:HSP20 family protein
MVSQEVTPREKRELQQPEERTEAGRFFSPYADIHENDRAVIVALEVPGVDKNAIDIQLEKGVLTVKGTVDAAKYESLRPIYSEYNIGNYVRTFAVSPKIDGSAISATVTDGVLRIELPKAKEALPRRIATPGRRYSSANASSTLPGEPTIPPLPAVTYTIPPATTGPGPSIEPPSALTPLTVGKSRFVSNVHRTLPSSLE